MCFVGVCWLKEQRKRKQEKKSPVWRKKAQAAQGLHGPRSSARKPRSSAIGVSSSTLGSKIQKRTIAKVWIPEKTCMSVVSACSSAFLGSIPTKGVKSSSQQVKASKRHGLRRDLTALRSDLTALKRVRGLSIKKGVCDPFSWPPIGWETRFSTP